MEEAAGEGGLTTMMMMADGVGGAGSDPSRLDLDPAATGALEESPGEKKKKIGRAHV